MTTDNGTVTATRLRLAATAASPQRPVPRTSVAATAAARSGASPSRGSLSLPARIDPSEVLPPALLRAQLRREQLRVDRSGAPLSLVIYRLAAAARAEENDRLRDTLLAAKRETDIVGQLDEGVLAIICPDTGRDGIQAFIAKIDNCTDDLPYSVESATYPDHLFETLAAPAGETSGPSPLLLGASQAANADGYFLKRGLDIVGASIALALFAPVMLATALAVKLSSPGPVIFRQTRLGKGGQPFTFLKFRSMVVNGDDRIHREFVERLIKGQQDAEPGDADGFKIKADPRVTMVGRFIRKTSIDELPQLFNVLKGDLSMVGPRPPLPYEAANYRSWHLRRVLDIRPGITGLWQVEGRSRVTFEEMVRMDLRYIRGCSLSLDLRILLKTVGVVISGAGGR